LNEPYTIFPLLLQGVNPQTQLTYKNIPIYSDQILDIVQNSPIQFSFPFTINVYTSYSSVRKKSKEIQNNMIGQLQCENSTDIFSVFLTPDIERSHIIRINALDQVKHSVKFNRADLLASTPITEGNKTVYYSPPKEVVLNQKSCICDHEETKKFSTSQKYRNLGINYNIYIHKKIKFIITYLFTFKFLAGALNFFSMKIWVNLLFILKYFSI
jgi:hypothetical protein